MKTALSTLLLVLSSHFIQAQTNVYQPYPLDNASWTIQTQYYNGMGVVEDWETETWGGEVVINGQIYTQVTGDVTIVGVRQDIPNEKIYYVDSQNTEHDASFDQSVQLGDTILLTEAFRTLNMHPWPTSSTWSGTDTVLIQGIDSLLIGPVYRKRFFLDGVPFNNTYPYDCSYICGVGCSGYVTFEAGFSLNCFYVEGALYFGDPFNPYCTAGIEELLEVDTRIYPNPSNDVFFIDYDESAILLEINLFDLTGKRITSFDKNKAKSGFDISNYPSGLYLVEAIFEKGKSQSTLVKE